MRTLNDSEQRTVQTAVGGATIHSCTIARLYYGSDNVWSLNGMGAIAIVTDSGKPAHFLKLVDLNNRSVEFTQELYEGFEYAKPRPFFHTFETDNEVIGLSFADEGEANEFYSKVVECKNAPAGSGAAGGGYDSRPVSMKLPPPAPPAGSHASMTPVSSPPPLPPSASYSAPSPPPAASSSSPTSNNNGTMRKNKKKMGGNFFSSVSGIFNKKDEVDDFKISEPSNFRHLSSIGWNPSEGSFEIRNIPPEWRKLFQAAGIKKSELKNKDTAALVMNIIETSGVDLGAPPPPPPPGGRPGAPSGGAPPPPPPPNAPAPPPPPSFGGPAAPPPPPMGGGGGGGGRNALLDQIKSGASLKHVDEAQEAPRAPPPPAANNLADTLARAMEARRAAIKEDNEPAEEEWSDADWSDE